MIKAWAILWLVFIFWAYSVYGESVHQPCDFESSHSSTTGDLELAKKVEAIFSQSCKRCHGKGQTGGAAVMEDIMNRDQLLEDGIVDLAAPSDSRLIRAVNRPQRWMPLGGDKLPQADLDALLAWVKAGAPDWAEPAATTDPILKHYQEAECIAHDISQYTAKDAYYLRYLTFGHLKGKDFIQARDGAIKLINSLTFNAVPRAPKYVDKFGKILRIDLRYYSPNFDFHAWENLVIAGYPYAYASFDDKVYNFYVEKVNKLAYSERAFIRGDWFVEHTSQSPNYYKILRLPSTLFELEFKVLGIDTDKELVSGYAKRGSVAKSGVTNYPRLVDRFVLDLFAGGVATEGEHWITRDFSSDKGTSNIYAFPFGPRILGHYHGWTDAQFFAAKVFENQAGESITRLPNGLQFYGIWDGKGNRVDRADPQIAVDRSALFDDLTVRNAVSCMMCHAGGPNPFDDDSVIRHVRSSPSFSVGEVKAAEELFFAKDQRDEAFGKHAKAFKAAMTAIGLTDPAYLTPGGEPTSGAFRKFTGYLTCQDLAWELGISLASLQSYLHHSPDLARELGLADCQTGRLSRENYDHLFATIVKQFDIGLQIPVGGHVVVTPNKCKYIITNRSNRTVKFKAFDVDVRLDHGQVKAFEFASPVSGRLTDTWEWVGNRWVTYYGKWGLVDCRNFQFLQNNGRVGLYND